MFYDRRLKIFRQLSCLTKKMQMHILIEAAAMTGLNEIKNKLIINFSVGELDLAIADYSMALEIDSKSKA